MKKAIFLTGSMGAGKSTILKMAEPIVQKDYVLKCKEFDILGLSNSGADTLSRFKKIDVLKTLQNYEGKLIIAGEFYSKQKDIDIYKDLGFEVIVILLNVTRNEIYKRILKRGGGVWNEKTYFTNIKNRVAFFKKHKGMKQIWVNESIENTKQNFQKLIAL